MCVLIIVGATNKAAGSRLTVGNLSNVLKKETL
jgi:hypothetical protein